MKKSHQEKNTKNPRIIRDCIIHYITLIKINNLFIPIFYNHSFCLLKRYAISKFENDFKTYNYIISLSFLVNFFFGTYCRKREYYRIKMKWKMSQRLEK